MARTIYGGTSADYAVAPGGRIVPGATFEAYTAKTGGSRITDLLDADGNATSVVTASSTGLIYYSGPDDGSKDPHWLQPTAGGERTAVVPLDNVGETGATPSLSIGTVTTGTAGATLSGTDEAPVLSLVLPSAGADGVNTAAIQDGAVTSAKIADGTIVNADISASAAIDGSKIVGLGNLLTANQAACTDTSVWSAYAVSLSSTLAGRITVTAGGASSSNSMYSPATATPCTPGRVVTATARITIGSAGASAATVRVEFRNSSGATIGSAASRSVTSGDATVSVVGTAPANTAYVNWAVWFTSTGPGDFIHVQTPGFWFGTGGTWALPGVPITGLKPALTAAARTSDYVVGATDSVVAVDTTSGAVTVTLPPAADSTGQSLRIVKTAGANTLTISRAGSDTISPSSGTRTSVAFPSATHGEMMLASSGTGWHVVSGQASDETVGRRLWKWEQALAATSTTAGVGWQLIHADTGMRDISGSLVNGWTGTMHVRRVGNVVTYYGDGMNKTAATSDSALTFATGFTPALSGVDIGQGIDLSNVTFVACYVSGSTTLVVRRSQMTGQARVTLPFNTSAAWPSSLPGSASGSIPTGA